MQGSTVAIYATLVLGVLTAKAQSGGAQSNPSGVADPSVVAASDQDTANSAIVTGQPFAATKYLRKVKVLPDGKQTVLLEHHRLELARDAAGRIRMKGGGELPYECEHWAAPARTHLPDSECLRDRSSNANYHALA
jgi:hypothetical protein